MAAAISYWALLSLFPLALVVAALARPFIDTGAITDALTSVAARNISLTPEGEAQLHDVLADILAGATGFGVVAVVGLIWSALGMFTAVRAGVNAAWGGHERRHFLRGRLLDLAFLGALGLLFVASVIASVLSRVLADVHIVELLRDGLLVRLAVTLSPAAVAALAFAAIYWRMPAVPVRLRDVWPGVLVATVGFEVAKWGFALYAARLSRYSEVYGSLSVVISFLVFVYLTASVLLYGAEVAAAWPGVRARRAQGPDPDGARPLPKQLRAFGAEQWRELREGRKERGREHDAP